MSGGICLRLLVCRDLEVIGYGYLALAYSNPFHPHISVRGIELCCADTATSRSRAACGGSISKIGRGDKVVPVRSHKSAISYARV